MIVGVAMMRDEADIAGYIVRESGWKPDAPKGKPVMRGGSYGAHPDTLDRWPAQ